MTKKEKEYQKKAFLRYYTALERFYKKASQYYCTKTTTDLRDISFKVKGEVSGKNKGQYGFYFTNPNTIIKIHQIMELTNKESFIDLGCGIGNVQTCLKEYFNIWRADGYEIEDRLIEFAKEYLCETDIKKKDILTLKKNDLKEYNVIYFWEPLYDNTLAQKFIKNLEKIINEDQIIIYNYAGKMKDYLDNSKKLELILANEPLFVYKKIPTVKKEKI